MLLHVCNVFVMGVLFSLLSCRFISCVESDINCLKSIKAELEDPLNMLGSTWNFNNATKGFLCNFLGVECWHPLESKVLNIKLDNLGLKGQFPRGVANSTSLTGLDLSSNSLSGSIPEDIYHLIPYITFLDLFSNSFSGKIPSSIINCTALNVLKLDNNKLMGQIPLELAQMRRLRTFSVANNQLSGPVSNFMGGTTTGVSSSPNTGAIGVESYANNPGLCGAPLEVICPQHNWSDDFVRAFENHGALMLGSLGFGIGFAFSFSVGSYMSIYVRRVQKNVT